MDGSDAAVGMGGMDAAVLLMYVWMEAVDAAALWIC